MARRERSGRAAFAGLALLASTWGCDDARPKVQPAPKVAATPTASVAATVNTAAKLDVTPPATAPENRLRQQQVGRDLVIDSEGRWDSSCLIHRPCKVKAQALDLCPPGSDAPLWSTLPGKAEHFTDPRVAIKGQLVMTDHFFSTAVSCGKGQCCNGLAVDIVLAGPPYDLELYGLRCGGDESRRCCPFSARGEEVIASGILKYGSGRLYLTEPTLCRTRND